MKYSKTYYKKNEDGTITVTKTFPKIGSRKQIKFDSSKCETIFKKSNWCFISKGVFNNIEKYFYVFTGNYDSGEFFVGCEIINEESAKKIMLENAKKILKNS